MIDLLPGRDAAPLTAWLHDHEAPTIICRDRASAYAEAAKTAAPDAVQVADRFHLWQNLATAVDRLARRHRECLTGQLAGPTDDGIASAPELMGAMAQRRKAHHALVHEMIAHGGGIRQIARHLGWSHNTVSRYAHAATWQELMTVQKQRPSLLDPFKPHLIQRVDSGCLTASLLHREVTAQGFAGGYGIARAFIEQHRNQSDLRTMPRPLSSRQVTGWICRHPDNVSEHDTSRLQAVLDRCAELRTAAELVRSFGEIMTRQHGHRLTDWITTAE